jgi:hypothetical protein
MAENGALQKPANDAPSAPPKKDIWDVISALTVPFVTFVVGVLGAYATYSYNQADLRQKEQQQQAAAQVSQVQLLQQLFDFVASSDPQKREFGYEMYAVMGKGELAAKLIALKGDPAGVAVLQKLAKDPNPVVSAAAKEGLASMLRSQSSCDDFAKEGFRVQRTPAAAADYAAAAGELGVEPEALEAFMETETTASILPDGRPTILYERHIFSRLTDHKFDTSHPEISDPTAGGYGSPGAAQYDRLAKAAALSCPAALAATSWGAFTILGTNYKSAGYAYVDDFVKDIMSSGPKELKAAMTVLRSLGVVEPLKAKDWTLVARQFNGPGFAANQYDTRLRDAYARVLAAKASRPPA